MKSSWLERTQTYFSGTGAELVGREVGIHPEATGAKKDIH